jgi:hypothetical protein
MKTREEIRLIGQIKKAKIKLKVLTSKMKLATKSVTSAARDLERMESKLVKLQGKAKLAGKGGVSFGVEFTRARYLNQIRGPRGWVDSPGRLRRSERRFATRKEAEHHGKRFTKIEGHKSFRVFESNDPVNAYVNWKTGKTNPVIGLKRTNR